MRSFTFTPFLLAASAPACFVVDHDHGYHHDDPIYVDPGPYVPPMAVADAPIDVGAFIEAEPGVGAGLFIEYEEGGVWHVFATCDSESSGFACEWDVVVSVPRSFDLVLTGEDDLESEDTVLQLDEGALRLWTLTDFDVDGMVVEAPPGEPVRFDVLLDGWPAPRYVRWIGGGILQEEAPSTPFELVPSEAL